MVKQRIQAQGSTDAPLSATVPHFADSVRKESRVERFTRVKASAMLTVCGTEAWAKFALQVAAQQRATRTQSEGPPLRGSVLESSLERAPWAQQRATSAS
eukprot:1291157-Alexandrium_andersonii.AAC.1